MFYTTQSYPSQYGTNFLNSLLTSTRRVQVTWKTFGNIYIPIYTVKSLLSKSLKLSPSPHLIYLYPFPTVCWNLAKNSSTLVTIRSPPGKNSSYKHVWLFAGIKVSIRTTQACSCLFEMFRIERDIQSDRVYDLEIWFDLICMKLVVYKW